MLFSSHLNYYNTQSIVTAIFMAGIGWLTFVHHSDSGVKGMDDGQMIMFFLAAFWLHSAMFIISAFLGPFFLLTSSQVYVVMTEWIMRIAIVFFTTAALARYLLYKAQT